MSKEPLQHLNTNVLIGNTISGDGPGTTGPRSKAAESNHYPGPVPVADVERRLFHWQAESRRVAVEVPADVATMSHLGPDDRPGPLGDHPDRQAIARSDRADGSVIGIFTGGYVMHQYRSWLLDTAGCGGALGLPGAPDAARVCCQQVVVHRSLADRLQ